jgi:hypothetical protein
LRINAEAMRLSKFDSPLNRPDSLCVSGPNQSVSCLFEEDRIKAQNQAKTASLHGLIFRFDARPEAIEITRFNTPISLGDEWIPQLSPISKTLAQYRYRSH